MSVWPGLRVVRAHNPSPMTLDGTRTYIVGRGWPVVIDPGPDHASHLAALLAALGGKRPAAILLTHGHTDHAALAPALARATGAPLMMARGALASAAPRESIDRWLADGEVLESDAGPLRACATPGHAPEHLCFAWTGAHAPAGCAVFVGDLLMGEGDTALVAPPEGDLEAYLRSLDRVAELVPGVLFPAHGPPLADASGALARYREHRRQRIEQVARALRDAGSTTAREMVAAVYGPSLPATLRDAAAGSISAVLAYLVARGEARALPGESFAPAD